MTFDESFDERTERQHCETSCAGVFQGKPDQPVSESATPEALVDLGVDERDQAGACAIRGEANHLTVNRQLVAITVRRVSHLDTLHHSHARNIRTISSPRPCGESANTLGAAVLGSDPRQVGGQRVIFLSGDDAEATSEVLSLFEDAHFFVVITTLPGDVQSAHATR
jgi:hypothetical protein